MKNKYVDFITDDHLLSCISNLYNSYLKAKSNISKKNFYSNKVDTIKLTFDSKFNELDEESLIQAEILRQIDKSINNSIGTFHEQVLGGIKGYEVGNLSGFDIKAKDDSLFAIFQFTEMSVNLKDGVFEKLSRYAKLYKKSSFYNVDFCANDIFLEKWIISEGESFVSHKRVFKISATKFYALLTGQDDALEQLNSILPVAIKDFFSIKQKEE